MVFDGTVARRKMEFRGLGLAFRDIFSRGKDVFVQIYEGYLNTKNVLSDETFTNMKMVSKEQDGIYVYEIEAPTRMVGHCGYTVRIVPQYMDKVEYIPGIIKWF